jgi:hypothetical protein
MWRRVGILLTDVSTYTAPHPRRRYSSPFQRFASFLKLQTDYKNDTFYGVLKGLNVPS